MNPKFINGKKPRIGSPDKKQRPEVALLHRFPRLVSYSKSSVLVRIVTSNYRMHIIGFQLNCGGTGVLSRTGLHQMVLKLTLLYTYIKINFR